MKTTIMAAVLMICAAGAGFVIGRGSGLGQEPEREAETPQASVPDKELAKAREQRIAALEAELAEARERIAALEAELAEAKKDAQRVRKRAAQAEEAVGKALKENKREGESERKDDGVSVSVMTNVDVVAEMKKQLPEEAFVAATNALSRMKVANAERAKGRREYLASLDVSGLSAKEQESHRRFMELFDRREMVLSKMKGLIPDQKTIGELVEIDMQMQPLAKEERKALLGAVVRELGYTGEDGAIVTDTLEGIFDCTGSGGPGGLGGLMDGAEIQPGVSVETHVIGL